MKTCKKCIYHSKLKLKKNVFDPETYYAECHLYPKTTVTFSEHWCGQLTQHLDDEITMHLERADRIKKKLGI